MEKKPALDTVHASASSYPPGPYRQETIPCRRCDDHDCPIKRAIGMSAPCAPPHAHALRTQNPAPVRRITLPAGGRIDSGDFSPDIMFRITSGMLMQEYILKDKRRHVAAFRTGGDMAWPLPCRSTAETMAQDSAGGTAEAGCTGEYHEAVRATEVCVISTGTVTEMAEDPAALSAALYSAAKAEVTRTQARMLTLARLTAAERIAGFLIDLAGRIGRQTAEGTELKLDMRRERIADHLGMQPETISRTLSAFRKSGIIRLPRPSVVIIPDIAALADRAVGNA